MIKTQTQKVARQLAQKLDESPGSKKNSTKLKLFMFAWNAIDFEEKY